MPEQSQYAAAANVPLIKSPSLRIPPPVELPPDIHPLPDSVTEYFVYPFTLEPHVLTLEASRRQTLAAQKARGEAYLKARADERERWRKEALRRVAPGFDGQGTVLVPTRKEGTSALSPGDQGASPPGAEKDGQPKDVMDDLVDQLARMEGTDGS